MLLQLPPMLVLLWCSHLEVLGCAFCQSWYVGMGGCWVTVKRKAFLCQSLNPVRTTNNIVYGGNIGIVEKKMETCILEGYMGVIPLANDIPSMALEARIMGSTLSARR